MVHLEFNEAQLRRLSTSEDVPLIWNVVNKVNQTIKNPFTMSTIVEAYELKYRSIPALDADAIYVILFRYVVRDDVIN